MAKKKKRNRRKDKAPKVWHVWGRLVRVHKDKKKYTRKRKHKGDSYD